MIGLGWVDATAFRRGNDAFYAQYREGRLDIDAYIAFATAPLRAHSTSELAAAHARFMVQVIAPALRPQAKELVESHRRRGDRSRSSPRPTNSSPARSPPRSRSSR